jgi:hypothetical protein
MAYISRVNLRNGNRTQGPFLVGYNNEDGLLRHIPGVLGMRVLKIGDKWIEEWQSCILVAKGTKPPPRAEFLTGK